MVWLTLLSRLSWVQKLARPPKGAFSVEEQGSCVVKWARTTESYSWLALRLFNHLRGRTVKKLANGEPSPQGGSTGPGWKAACFDFWQNETSFIRDQYCHLPDDGSPLVLIYRYWSSTYRIDTFLGAFWSLRENCQALTSGTFAGSVTKLKRSSLVMDILADSRTFQNVGSTSSIATPTTATTTPNKTLHLVSMSSDDRHQMTPERFPEKLLCRMTSSMKDI